MRSTRNASLIYGLADFQRPQIPGRSIREWNFKGAIEYYRRPLRSRIYVESMAPNNHTASNKDHHFVPQFYLRNFASDEKQKQICLFNIERGILMSAVSLRDQCAKHRYYGSQELEHALGKFESRWGLLFKRIIQEEKTPNDFYSFEQIVKFVSVQARRTISAEQQSKEMWDAMTGAAFRGHPEEREKATAEKQVDRVLENLKLGLGYAPILYDLKIILVINRTQTDFLTSDNPVVSANNFYPGRHPNLGSGLASSGLIKAVPISPRLLIILFDSGIYTLTNTIGHRVITRKRRDIDALNELQWLNAEKNLYFSKADEGPRILDKIGTAYRNRGAPKSKLTEFVRSKVLGNWVLPDSDKAVEQADDGSRDSLIQVSSLVENIALRLSFLSNRNKPKFFDNGSARGSIRDPAWHDLVSDFYDCLENGDCQISDMPNFIASHPEWPNVGAWKKRMQ